jgi:hypothetical protein
MEGDGNSLAVTNLSTAGMQVRINPLPNENCQAKQEKLLKESRRLDLL